MTQLLDSLLPGHVTELAPLRLAGGRLVVIVPHPDDEALATGGLIAHHASVGDRVIVVAVTDGEGAFGGADGDLAAVRRDEQRRSLDALGVDPADVIRLGLPDASVASHVTRLAATLAELVGHRDVLVAPSPWDWHPDHEACGRAARSAAGRVGSPTLWSTFWAHHHPEHLLQQSAPLLRFGLTDDALERRGRAVACHRSQFGDTGAETVVHREQIAHLISPAEYYHR